MTILFIRPFGLLLLSLALAACTNPGPAAATPAALGVDLGASGPVIAGAGEGHALSPRHYNAIQKVHEGHVHAQGTGTVNSVDAAGHKVNISHEPIPAIGFPAMTMDFGLAPGVNLAAVKPGSRVTFSVEQGAGGMYEIQSIAPAAGGRR